MKIIAVDPFYLKMPQITDAADGTQDTLVVRVQTDEGITGVGGVRCLTTCVVSHVLLPNVTWEHYQYS